MQRWEPGTPRAAATARSLALAIGIALLPGAVRAQPGPGDVLQGIELRRAGEHPEVVVRFRAPVRLLVRGVQGPARVFLLPVEALLSEGPPGRPEVPHVRETARPPPGATHELLHVSYEPRAAGPGLLELRFRTPVVVEVAPGRDGRSVTATWLPPAAAEAGPAAPEPPAGPHPVPPGSAADKVGESPGTPSEGPSAVGPGPAKVQPPRPPDPGWPDPAGSGGSRAPRGSKPGGASTAPAPRVAHTGWSVQVLATDPGEEAPPPDRIREALPGGLRDRLYLVRTTGSDGRRLLRYRVGPFPSLSAAKRARDALAPAFPDAWVAPESAAVPEAQPAPAPGDGREAAGAPPGSGPVEGALPGTVRARLPAPSPRPPPGSGRRDAREQARPGRASAPAPGRRAAARAEGGAPPGRPPGAVLLERARSALRDGHPEDAIPLLEAALEGGGDADRRTARELLGLARERAGQLAHARAEYEHYLAEWPEGEGSERVRQRLEALLGRAAVLPAPLRPPGEGGGATGDPLSGSLYTGYRRETRRTRLTGGQVLDSSLYGDLYLRGARRTGPLALAAELSGSYLLDLGNRSDDVGRVRLLHLEVGLPERGLAADLGRQTGNRFGVTGRFDGIELRGEPTERVELRVFGGFPTEPLVSNRVRTERVFAGAGLGLRELRPGLDLDLHAVEQWIGGRTDRRAVGGEVRYAGERLFAVAFADWDLLFDALNVLALHASLRVGDRTHLYLSADERRLPELTLGNALLGTVFDDLGDLRRARPEADLESLARARTARSRILRLGASRALGDHLHLTGELELSDLAGISSDADVAGFDGTGLELGGFAQLVATDVLGLGEVATLTASARDGERVDLFLLLLDLRFRLGRHLRLVPLLLAREQRARLGDDRLALEPGLRLDLQWGPFTGELEGRYRRVSGELAPGAGDETGLVFEAGIRYDF